MGSRLTVDRELAHIFGKMFHKNAAAKENYRFPVSSFQFDRWLRKSDGQVERIEYVMTPVSWRREAWRSGFFGKPLNPCYCAEKLSYNDDDNYYCS